jgi:Ran GTPase-activating protein (RanGAP) involved in mRNA processing and transport
LSSALSKLETLHLGESSIADLGAKAFANALKENTTLEELGLQNNSINDEGAEALVDAPSLLKVLHLEGNNVCSNLANRCRNIIINL